MIFYSITPQFPSAVERVCLFPRKAGMYRCISRMFAPTSFKPPACSPARARRGCAHGTAGDSRERSCASAAPSPLPVLNPCFPGRDP